ncbi:DMT family transporter [Sulfitobacter sp. JB4-11]|uniref:DMT family transporter n=1 Tax=Sulfitobacter rhodophyticola TaxID=3238304 RepID=UPI0035159801
MRLVLLIALTMLAFAANSILTRLAVDGGHIDPSGFAIVRVLSGAVVLSMLITVRGGGLPLFRKERLPGAISLTVYMIGFSLAYLTLDAGLGALILFGVVQITMFAHAALTGAAPNLRQMTGAGAAFAGLLLVLWPGAGAGTDLPGAALMACAGIGWASYTIAGRHAADPLAATSANFVLCLPVMVILLSGTGLNFGVTGIALGILCGGLTSGLGYALWYTVLPRITGPTAAVVQLSVPVIALIAGTVFLGEALGPAILVATVLVVGGIGWAVTGQSVQAGRRSR